MNSKMRLMATAIGLAILGGWNLMNDAQDARAAGTTPPAREIATLGGGCFWCMEAVFEELSGVLKVESGFAGGVGPASYQEVCTGNTGHAEVIQVTYDPGVISYNQILAVFFATHDPTSLNRQGADVGTQYRSAIFTSSDEQKRIAAEAIAKLERDGVFAKPVVTQIEPLKGFSKADEHHQDYYRRNMNQGYCQVVINPKLTKFRREFSGMLKR